MNWLLYLIVCLTLMATGGSCGKKKKKKPLPEEELILNIRLTRLSNTKIEAVIDNTAQHTTMKVLKSGTFFDELDVPIRRLTVVRAQYNTEAPFTGIKKTPALSRLQKYDFWEIAPGTSIKEVWDITETWDILDGGDYFVSMSGLLPNIDNIGMKDGDRFINFAKPVVFRSNTLTINIEDTPRIQGLQNMERKTRHEKEKQDACNSDQRDVLKKVYSNCHKLAKEAAEAARTGPADRVIEHFQVADNFTRAAVSSVFDLVSMECGEAGRTVRNHCSKEDTLCDAKTEIYINPDSGDITFCEAFWAHPPMPKDCERRMITPNGDSWVTPKFGIPWWDITWEGNSNVFQMTMLIHVLTQMSSNARAQGFAYTYKTMKHLSYMDNLYNAETYALFAGAVKLNCPVK